MNDAPLVLSFTDSRCCEVALSGGKGSSLARMTSFGLPVPPGFVITSAAFSTAIEEDELRACIRANDMAAARELVAAVSPPVELVAEHYSLLNGRVAVRSSACAEDSEAASYAGQQETYLNVDSFDEVLKRIVDCWLSFFADRAVFYRQEKGSLDDVAMAVVVQQMVDSQKSGVLFTVDPVSGRRDRMVVEAAFGLGEQVVSGEVTPDHYILDGDGVIKRSRIVEQQVLDEAECKVLAYLGRNLAELNGTPQDIEWGVDADGVLFLLQSRPITTV